MIRNPASAWNVISSSHAPAIVEADAVESTGSRGSAGTALPSLIVASTPA
ncbi:MAG TPA: hypothetical protein VH417_20295 [Vicinamibacterales bacterium]